eukprot:gene6490-biopygen7469
MIRPLKSFKRRDITRAAESSPNTFLARLRTVETLSHNDYYFYYYYYYINYYINYYYYYNYYYFNYYYYNYCYYF